MPTRKIGELSPPNVCHHPEHDPPTMMLWSPGIYEHECPGCGNVQRFVVAQPIWMATALGPRCFTDSM